jgi:hypothetical protein
MVISFISEAAGTGVPGENHWPFSNYWHTKCTLIKLYHWHTLKKSCIKYTSTGEGFKLVSLLL